jgi:hypothetical protein
MGVSAPSRRTATVLDAPRSSANRQLWRDLPALARKAARTRCTGLSARKRTENTSSYTRVAAGAQTGTALLGHHASTS